MSHTVQLHRVINAPPERVFRAFIEPEALVKWYPPNGFTAKVFQMDSRAGGSFKMSFTNFSTGKSHTFGGKFLEIVPNQQIIYTNQFEDPKLPGEIRLSVSMRKVRCGTDLKIVQEGIPEAIPVDGCYLSWQQCLNLLAQLVEPEIPDEI